jgi:hypothetical protein
VNVTAIAKGSAQLVLGGRKLAANQRGRAESWLTSRLAWLAMDARARNIGARLGTAPACAKNAGQMEGGARFSGLALAETRTCPAPQSTAAATSSKLGKGMPKDPLLDMLRLRVLPIARGCFRADRKGRARSDTRAVFAFTLADREVVDAQVEGAISETLRTCLLDAVDSLEVPRFTGLVRVRYPLVTESVPEPEQIELTSTTAREVDALIGPDGATENP